MSLIFVKNKDNSVKNDKYTGLLPYRFSNYFTQPIKIAPNSQIAYVNSSFNMDSAGYLQGDPYYVVIGNSLYNATIPLYSPATNVDDWDEGINLLGALVNQYGTDNNYNDTFFRIEEVFGVEQIQFDYGNNFQYTSDGKTNIRTPQRVVNDTFNQLFNCCGANPKLSYTGGLQDVPAGINHSDNTFYQGDLKFIPINPNNLDEIVRCDETEPDCFSQLPNSSALQPITSTANFYNTQFGWYKITDDTYDWDNNSASTYFVYEKLPFNEGFYPAIINNTSIKQNVNFLPAVLNGVPTDNGGGHTTISKLDKFSGGYGIHSFRNVNQTLAKNHYDEAFMNLSGQTGRTTGFCGISPQFLGVIPTELVFGGNAGKTEQQNKEFFIQFCDLNNAVFGVDDEFSKIDPMNPFGSICRYVYGVRIYEIAGSLVAQAQILDPNADMVSSKYIDVGFPLDIYKLSKGIIPNLQNGDDYVFDADADYRINIHDADASSTATSLFFRFRWTSPYCMNIEYTLSVEGDENSYNVLTDAPYDFADYDGITATTTDVNNEVAISLTPLPSGTDGGILSFPIGNEDTADTAVSAINFTDSGGGGGDYQPNEDYTYTFDAGAGNTINAVVNSFEYEHSSFAMYDRASIRVSNDGITFNNINVPWMNTTSNTTFPYSDSYGAGGQTGSSNGWVMPQNTTIAQSLYRDFLGDNTATLTFPQTINTGFRYVRFGFTSDGSSQEAGWDIKFTTANPITTSTTNYTADPTKEWVCLFSMENYNRTINPSQDKYVIPSYMGDLGLVQYPTTLEHSVGRKGYFDFRKSYRYNNRIQEKQINANLFKPLSDLPFFIYGYTNEAVLRISNDVNLTTPKLLINGELQEPESFTNDGYSTKQIRFLLNTIEDDNNLDFFKRQNGARYFTNTGLPQNLELGRMLGLVSNDITGNGSVVILKVDIENGGNDYRLYGFNGPNIITSGELTFTNHIQINNLPIQSQNGVKSTMNKTIYVINSLNLNNSVNLGSITKYTDTAPHLLWIDLNNYGEMNINELSILITNDDNVEQKLMKGFTELTLMIREKPKEAEGYMPNNIPVR